MSHEILQMTAMQLLQHYRDKSLSPVEVAAAMLDQIEAVDPATNGFCLLDRETSLALAAESEQRYQQGRAQGLLDGVASTAAGHLQQIDLSRQLQRGVLIQAEAGWQGRRVGHAVGVGGLRVGWVAQHLIF